MTKRAKEIVPTSEQFEVNGFYERLIATRRNDPRALLALGEYERQKREHEQVARELKESLAQRRAEREAA